jgi:hypothetical protein
LLGIEARRRSGLLASTVRAAHRALLVLLA